MPFPLTLINISSLIACLLALLCPYGATSALISTIRRRRRGVRGAATLVALHGSVYSRNGREMEIEFSTYDGRRVRKILDETASYRGYEAGDRLSILYDPHDPENVELPSRFGLRIMYIVISYAAGPFGLWGLLHLFTAGSAF